MQRIFFLLIFFLALGVKAQVNNLSINEVPEDLKKNSVLVDVRTPEEYAEGHLPKAVNINIYAEDFLSQMGEIKKNENVLLYCRSGKRSARAAALLDSIGYQKVYNLEGGYMAWKEKHSKE